MLIMVKQLTRLELQSTVHEKRRRARNVHDLNKSQYNSEKVNFVSAFKDKRTLQMQIIGIFY